jgi:hypothetical protein
MLCFGDTEVIRMLKNGSPYISLHTLDDVVGIGADSIRLYIAPEGTIETEGFGTSGEALSQAAMKAASEKTEIRGERKRSKCLPQPSLPMNRRKSA